MDDFGKQGKNREKTDRFEINYSKLGQTQEEIWEEKTSVEYISLVSGEAATKTDAM